MKKNLIFITGIISLSLVLSGCGKTETPKEKTEKNEKSFVSENQKSSNESRLNTCAKEKVNLPNYGDPGQGLQNCFVEYPGEPSRQDKSYYIVEDICGQFSKEFMENMTGEKIEKIESPQIASLNNCSYYFDEKKYIILNLEYLSAENQKKGNLAMDRKVEENAQISMENSVVYQEDGAINVVYLILGPEKFISIRPSAKDVIANEKFIGLAANIAEAIGDYK